MTTLQLPGAPSLAYDANNQLCVDGVSVADLAREHGTPLFIYSKATMLRALQAYQQGFAGRNALICFAMKANSTLAVLQVFAQAGCGFDIVSGGELERALAAGACRLPALRLSLSARGAPGLRLAWPDRAARPPAAPAARPGSR